MTKINIALGLAIIALILGGIGLVGGNHQSVLGGVSNSDTLSATSIQVGSGCGDSYSTCLGSTITKFLTGTVTCGVGATSIAGNASSTYECTVANVAVGDKVFVTLASTTPTNISLADAFASSSAGFIEISLQNTATTSKNVAGATSSVQYLIVR